MYICYDFVCNVCKYCFDDLIDSGEPNPTCPTCNGNTTLIPFKNNTLPHDQICKDYYKWVNSLPGNEICRTRDKRKS